MDRIDEIIERHENSDRAGADMAEFQAEAEHDREGRGLSGGGCLCPGQVRVGTDDPAGREIVDVLWLTDDYAVYRWRKCAREASFFGRGEKTYPTYGISPLFGNPEQRGRFALVGPDLARLSALQKGVLSSRDSINGEIARSISLAIEGHTEEAKKTIASLHQRLQAIRNTEDRAYYVVFLGLAALLFALPMLLVHLAGVPLQNALPQMLHVAGFGALGGFFSVLTKINRLQVDPEASRGIIAVSASTRILLAVIGAIAIYTFLLSTIGQAVLNAERLQEMATVCTFAFLAGFSEHFVPGILRNLEQRSQAQPEAASEPQDTPVARKRSREL